MAGPLLVSNRLAEPDYDVMLAWPPAGWESKRRRYFALNWIRFIPTLVAFGLFLLALVTP